MKKIKIENRKGQKIAVIVEENKQNKGLAFVMHGLGGFKEQAHIETMAQSFKDVSCTIVRFDTTNTLGESDGDYADATVTNYYQDLEDVIVWAKQQDWYSESFYLTGHSLGAGCVASYAENYPSEVKALALISSVVSGVLSLEVHPKEQLDEWKNTGWYTSMSHSKPGVEKNLKWSHMEDRLQYDLLEKINQLTMPVLLAVGENDTSTPLKHQQILLEALPGQKELQIIKNAPHTFREPGHIAELKNNLDNWLKKLI